MALAGEQEMQRLAFQQNIVVTLKDLKHSVRMFVQTPSLTITATVALVLGIATNTAIFSVINTVLLKPFVYPYPERIVMWSEHLSSDPQWQCRAYGI